MHRPLLLSMLIAATGASVTLPAAQEAAPIKKITSIEGITEYKLENGMRVLLFPDASKPTVTVNLTIFVGSRHEGYGEAGMAHLLEHMLFKGTPDRPDIPALLKARGAEFNGTTWVDRTNYYETLPAGDENLEFALALEADRMMNSTVKGEHLSSEMTVVRNEFERGENDPTSILMQRMLAVAFEWHNYGKSTIGNRADIERVPVENLREFYRRFYQPDNAMLVVAGSFDDDKALALINKYFGAIPRPARKLNATYTEEPEQDGERLVRLKRVGDVSVVGLAYHIPAGGDADFPAVEVMEGILTAESSGRLYKSLVETKKASSVFGVAFSWHDPGVVLLMAEVAAGNEPDVVLGTMIDTIDEFVEKGVTEQEVERIRQQILKQRELAAANTSRLAIRLSEWASLGDWRLYFVHRDRLEKVTAEDVKRVAEAYLKPDNRTIGQFLPTKSPDRSPIPKALDLAATIGDYKGRSQTATGEAFDVSPANIEKRTRHVTLSSGIPVALLEKKTRGQSVNIRIKLKYGDEKNLQGMAKAAELLPELITHGTKKLSYQELLDALDKHRVRLNATGTPGELNLSVQTTREHLKAAWDLLQQIIREPALSEKEFELIKQEQIADLEKQLTDPQSLATTLVRKHVTPYPTDDPRYVPTIPEELAATKAVTAAEVAKIYREYLGGQNGEVAVVGDFDGEEAVKALTEIFGDWKAQASYARLTKTVDPGIKGGVQDINTPDKANAEFFGATVFPLRDDHPDYPALVIGNFVLGGGSLSSRLGDRVRQKEGLSYGVGSVVQSSSLDERTAFFLYAICNPENMPKVKTAIREELDKILQDGVTAEELEIAKKAYIQNMQVSRTDDAGLAGTLVANLSSNRSMEYYANLEKSISELTPNKVLEALKRHIDPKKIFIAAAGDFTKKPSSGKPQAAK
ncbi:MAG: M16 family metallopeptidase [Planctomycetaceae bacterium]